MAAWVVPAIAAAGSITSAYLSSQAAKSGADAGGKAQLKMYNQSRQDMMPYMQYGQNALGTPEYERGDPIYGTTMERVRNPLYRPGNPRDGVISTEPKYLERQVINPDEITGYEQGAFKGYKEGTGTMPNALSSDNYQLPPSQQVSQFQASQGSELPGYNAPGQFQAGQNTGLQDFKFELNPDDPIYKWKQKQMEDAINRAAAARGNYNSRASINALGEGNMALAAQEMNDQYGRQLTESGISNDLANQRYGRGMGEYQLGYGQNMDTYNIKNAQAGAQYGRDVQQYGFDNQAIQQNNALARGDVMDKFNMDRALYGDQYGQFIDALKVGQGTANAAGNNAMITGQGLASSAQASGDANAAFWSGLGGMPQNAIAQNYYMSQLKQQPQPNALSYQSPQYGYGMNTGAPTINPYNNQIQGGM